MRADDSIGAEKISDFRASCVFIPDALALRVNIFRVSQISQLEMVSQCDINKLTQSKRRIYYEKNNRTICR